MDESLLHSGMIRQIKKGRYSVGNVLISIDGKMKARVDNPYSPEGTWAFQGVMVEGKDSKYKVGDFCSHWNRGYFIPC